MINERDIIWELDTVLGRYIATSEKCFLITDNNIEEVPYKFIEIKEKIIANLIK